MFGPNYSSGDSPAVATWLAATITIAEGSAQDDQLATAYSCTWDFWTIVAVVST
jgi:hypothetical protein